MIVPILEQTLYCLDSILSHQKIIKKLMGLKSSPTTSLHPSHRQSFFAQHIRHLHKTFLQNPIFSQARTLGAQAILSAAFRKFVADLIRARVLPDDGVVDGLSRGLVPHHRRLALVGHADGGNVRDVALHFFQEGSISRHKSPG